MFGHQISGIGHDSLISIEIDGFGNQTTLKTYCQAVARLYFFIIS
jgi:hypothetical protein